MVKQSNPAIHEEPRYQPAPIIPLKQEESLIDWLQNSGRLISSSTIDYSYQEEGDEEDYVEELVDSFDFEAEEVEDLEED
ncbi:DUF3134 domain-containing protein [Nostoc sp. CMAA1605]|uniref:DUF3134 domain-containing protein n=1 Tax=Nostoc sp. CMAA1605 TaxID=2055159 RepID=UPI001F4225D2|nr:DUF3134 domain-containing protein [Nostoc sp. CMAA1605]MCF4967124.1 hypothetical protein [Nostoc sp. CMAA1605]